jgi:hypothetical protein
MVAREGIEPPTRGFSIPQIGLSETAPVQRIRGPRPGKVAEILDNTGTQEYYGDCIGSASRAGYAPDMKPGVPVPKFRFTDAALRALTPTPGRPRIDYDDGDVRGFGLQVTPAGRRTFVLVYVAKATGQERRMVIGEFGPAPKLSLSAARARAIEIRAQVNAGRDPWAEGRVQRAQAVADKAKSVATLAALLSAYVGQLKAAGKPSWKEIEAAVKRDVTEPFPKLAAMRADQVTLDDVRPVLARLTKAGSYRAAEKLRAYLRAAFTAARAARQDAGMVAFDAFRLTHNPMLELRVSRPKEAAQAAASAARERKWALSEAQLRAYWKRLQALDTPAGALMRFHLLTGGQRMEQLARLTAADLDRDQATVTLRDTKGRRAIAHEHVVPLIPDALAALEAMGKGPHLFSVSGGEAAAVPHTLAAAMRALSTTMIEAGEVDRTITPGSIRRTVETRLAAVGVRDEVLARLLSHGLGGVQARNYNAHRYDDEKRAALAQLRTMLDEPKGTVTPFRRRKAG